MIDNEDLEVLYLKYRKFSVNFALKYVDQVDVAEDIRTYFASYIHPV